MSVIEPKMSIQQNKKQSDLEKRLRILRQQVYGKQPLAIGHQSLDRKQISNNQRPTTINYIGGTDVTYLHQDLLKIFILAGCALGIQLVLFILSKNRILNLNFF